MKGELLLRSIRTLSSLVYKRSYASKKFQRIIKIQRTLIYKMASKSPHRL